MKRALLLVVAALLAGCGESSVPAVQPRLMIIGMDGARADALQVARTPNLDALIASGFADFAAITGDISLSGPGWASMLSGVWCDKHGVLDNNVTWQNSRFDRYPHFLRRVEAAKPELVTASVSHWAPINDEILCADEAGADCPIDFVMSPATDAGVRDEVVRLLTLENPHALFMQFDDIDHAGHGDPPYLPPDDGFCPFAAGDREYRGQVGVCTAADFNPAYLSAIERTDSYIGEILNALHARPNFAAENWLILVSPDHGGGGVIKNQHGFPHAQDRRTFLIASGAAAAPLPQTQLKIVDVAATALTHLGISIDPAWNLDGQAVGIHNAGPYQDKPIPACGDKPGIFGGG